MALEVEERGTDQLLRFLEGAPANIDKATEEGLDLLGEMAEQKAKTYAPVRTGVLRESIRFIRRGFEVLLSSRVFYAVFQEFGTRFIAPRLFMTRALEEIRPLIAVVFRDKIEAWLQKRGE